jgi:hypothetical protein
MKDENPPSIPLLPRLGGGKGGGYSRKACLPVGMGGEEGFKK